MNSFTIFATTLFSILLAMFISVVQGDANSDIIVLNSFVFISTFWAIAMIYSKYKMKLKSTQTTEELMKGLNRLFYYRSANLPTLSALRMVRIPTTDAMAQTILYKVSKRMELGENFFDAIFNATANDKEISRNLSEYLGNIHTGIQEALQLYESRKKLSVSRSNALMSRYATCSMFVSTIAPSFVIFSFIGSMLISQTSSNIESIAIILLAAIPLTYSIINSVSARRFIG